MEVSDLFASKQGEGPSAGADSVFLRMRRCNLACTWCDTRYTWDEEDPGYLDYAEQSPRGVAEEVSRLIAKMQATNLVITGGEPLLWRPDLMTVLDLMTEVPATVEIETNGTMMPLPVEYDRAYAIRYNVSPKLSHSKNGARITLREHVLEEMAQRSSIFKIVVEGSSYAGDREVNDLLNLLRRFGVDNDRLWLMPQAKNLEQLDVALPAAKDLAFRAGVRVTDRAHIRWYGDVRGT